MGAWIEIFVCMLVVSLFTVAPLVGAWIEMVTQKCINCEKIVAPLVGAWIEMFFVFLARGGTHGRSSRGSVD